MNAPTLFDPQARVGDPSTSHEAARATRGGNTELVNLIREVVRLSNAPMSAFDIAYSVSQVDEFRWSEATIRTAVSRAGLHCVDTDGLTPRNRRCTRYVLSAGA